MIALKRVLWYIYRDKKQNERKHITMSVRIIVDSSSDLPKSVIEHYDIKIIPLSVHFGEEEYLDSINITPSQFYD